jgi:sec-independent protein translocase protein TatA
MPGFVGLPELLLLGFVCLIVFGPKRLPEMGRSLGHSLREFKSSVSGEHRIDVDAAQAVAVSTAKDEDTREAASAR